MEKGMGIDRLGIGIRTGQGLSRDQVVTGIVEIGHQHDRNKTPDIEGRHPKAPQVATGMVEIGEINPNLPQTLRINATTVVYKDIGLDIV